MRHKLGFDLNSAADIFGLAIAELANIEDTTRELTRRTLSTAATLLMIAPRPPPVWDSLEREMRDTQADDDGQASPDGGQV